MKISGLASGMDIHAIIKDMLQAQREPINKINQRKQYMEWQLNDYRQSSRELKLMDQRMYDNFLKRSNFMAKQVTISDPTSVSIKSISATADFSGSIAIHQLATQANWQSGKLTDDDQIDGTAKISELGITGPPITISAPNDKGQMETKTIEIEPDESIESVVSKIVQGTNVNAFFDANTGQIALTAKNSGAGSIDVEGLGNIGQGQVGKNAEFTFNGLKTERASNTFQISGFEINLKQVTQSPVSFSSAPDTEKVFNSITQFVDDYNQLIKELNDKIREDKYRNFPALTAEQKAEMTDKEIEQWEEKAKSGTLRKDPLLERMLSSLRSELNGTVMGSDGKELNLYGVGITTTKDPKEYGKLIIDEDKLRQSITDDPNMVYELFMKPNGEGVQDGLGSRVRKVLADSGKMIEQRAGRAGDVYDNFSLGRTLKDLDKQIEKFNYRLEMTENRLWKQFNAMEMAIQRANAQSAQLMNAFGGM